MIEVIEKYVDMSADFINNLFLFQIEFETGHIVPIGKIVCAFIFIVYALYFILDALGVLDKEE